MCSTTYRHIVAIGTGDAHPHRPTARFPPLDAWPRTGELGLSYDQNTRPLCRCAAGQEGPQPPACITSPCGTRHAVLSDNAHADGLDARVYDLPPLLPGRFALGAGLRPRVP